MHTALRLKRLRRAMKAASVPALLITHLPDVRYMTGFTGSNAAVAVMPRALALFTDGRYTAQAQEQVTSARVVVAKKSALRECCLALLASGAERCGFDPEHTTVAALAQMREALPGGRRRSFFAALESGLVARLREVKDEDELASMRAAAALGCELFAEILTRIEPGIPETTVAAELEHRARLAGVEAMSFETIVASGKRSALPHGTASTARLPRRGFVTLDFGVILRGYCSDMTRTVHLGRPAPRARAIYEQVLRSQEAAVATVRAGVPCGAVDEAARAVLREAGLAEYFSHSTGHGVGLEIHEAPRVAAGSNTVLEAGMVITIEPGVYIPGEFGLRIEDTVVVRDDGCEVLTPSPKAWTELGPQGKAMRRKA